MSQVAFELGEENNAEIRDQNAAFRSWVLTASVTKVSCWGRKANEPLQKIK